MRRRCIGQKQGHEPTGHYLRVRPIGVQWVDVGMSVEYHVECDGDWIVTVADSS